MIHRLRIDKRNTKSHLKSVKLTHIILLLDLVKGVSLNTEALKITKQDIDMQNISSNNLNRYCRISNRRYLGNKYKLRDFLRTTILKECGEFNVFADLFAGTGSVASLFEDKTLIVNDILYSNYVCHNAWFGTQRYSMSTIENYIKRYNKISVKSENYVSKNFANTFFSEYNCKKIGFIREDIEKSYENNLLSLREKHILIASLLYAMDKTANTCGHYDAYRKNGILDKELILPIPLIQEGSLNNRIYNTNANSLARRIVADVVYLDPPYNSRQYCDLYHLLENISQWEKPQVYGVAKKMDRSVLKSDYCTLNATKTFEDLVNNIKARYIVLSYNNMAQKGNNRSNARISDQDIYRILNKKGDVKTFQQEHKAFHTGKSYITKIVERLFVCRCF